MYKYNNATNIIEKAVSLDEAKGFYSPFDVKQTNDGFVVLYPRHGSNTNMEEPGAYLQVSIPATVLVDERGDKCWPFGLYEEYEASEFKDELASRILPAYERKNGCHLIRGSYGSVGDEHVFKVDKDGESAVLVTRDHPHINGECISVLDIINLPTDRAIIVVPNIRELLLVG